MPRIIRIYLIVFVNGVGNVVRTLRGKVGGPSTIYPLTLQSVTESLDKCHYYVILEL